MVSIDRITPATVECGLKDGLLSPHKPRHPGQVQPTSGEVESTVPPITPEVHGMQISRRGDMAKQPVRFYDFLTVFISDV